MGIRAILKAKSGTIATIRPDMTIGEAVALMTTRRIGAVLVTDGDKLAGMLSERDVMRGLSVNGAAVLGLRVDDLMSAPVITIRIVDSVADALTLMTERRIRHLPVVSDGRLEGIVSIGDLVKVRIAEAEREALALKDYIVSA